MQSNARGGIRGAPRRLALACALAVALVVVASAASGGFRQGAGAPIQLGASAEPVQIHAGDINGDGKTDLAVLDYDSDGNGQIAVYFGAGGGKFTKGPVSPVGTSAQDPDAFALGDLNGDHSLDVAVTEYNDVAIATYLGDGKGHFTVHGSETALQGGSQPVEAAIADLNGDHLPDLVVPNGFVAGVDFLEGNGAGAFTAFSGSPIDYENDVGPGNYVDGPAGAVVADFDGDQVPDALVLDYYNPGVDYSSHGTMQLFHGDGTGAFSIETTVDLPAVPGWFAPGDFNGDGTTDVVVSFPALNEVMVYLGNGDGTFTAQAPATTPDPTDVVVGDFNGDKRLDVGTIDGAVDDGAVDVVLGDGNGNLAAEPGGPFAINAGTEPELDWMDAADASGDHKTDLLAINDQPGAIDVLVTQGGALGSGTVLPVSGVAGTSVTIKGANLDTVAFVQFPGGSDGTITSQSAKQLQVTSPAGASQGKLTLIGSNGASTTSTVFTPIAAPVISSLSPDPGTKEGGTETINGQHFTGTTAVAFGSGGSSVPATSFRVISDSKITAVVPHAAPASIVVTNPSGHASTAFQLIQSPSIASFSPTHGPANATATPTVVHLSGADLQGVTSVTFDGKAADPQTFSISNDGQSMQVTVPNGAKTGVIVVKNVAASFSTIVNNDPEKTFTVDPPPTISRLSATFGTLDQTITITGTNLAGITDVRFGNGASTDVTQVSATSLEAEVPDTATPGKVTVRDANGIGTSGATFTPHIAPAVTSFSPSNAALPGASITINGSHFTGVSVVSFNGGAHAAFHVVSDGQLTATVPSSGAVSGLLTIFNPYGSTTANFYVVTAPSIADTGAFSPLAGGISAEVRITGQHLGGTTSVTFNGHAVTFTVDSDTQITAHPSATNDAGVVSVTNAAGTDSTTDSYSVVTLTSFSPGSGTAGDTVTINGTGLSTVTQIQLPGVALVTPVTQSNSQITVTMPSCGSNASATITIYIGSGLSNSVQSATTFSTTGLVACP
jgi:hypothetical protein